MKKRNSMCINTGGQKKGRRNKAHWAQMASRAQTVLGQTEEREGARNAASTVAGAYKSCCGCDSGYRHETAADQVQRWVTLVSTGP